MRQGRGRKTSVSGALLKAEEGYGAKDRGGVKGEVSYLLNGITDHKPFLGATFLPLSHICNHQLTKVRRQGPQKSQVCTVIKSPLTLCIIVNIILQNGVIGSASTPANPTVQE